MEKGIDNQYEIMIVGGGPAGISTWLHLQKTNPELASKTILIEKEKYPRDKVCGGAILDWGQYILKKLGIKISVPFMSINNAIYKNGKEEYHHKKTDFLKIVHRYEFDHFLAKEAINRGLKINQNEAFDSFIRKKNDLIINTNREKKYKVKILIGADGALSKVRENMDLPSKLRLATGIEFFSPMKANKNFIIEENSSVMNFSYIQDGLQGYIWHFPCIKEEVHHINHGICHTKLNPNKKQINIKDIFIKDLKLNNIRINKEKWIGHPIPWTDDYSKISNPNVLLIGDAAGIDPLIYGGIHLSLNYGGLATSEIVNAFENDNFSFENYENNFLNHNIGKYITKLTYLASEIYSDKIEVLPTIKKMLQKGLF